MGYDYHMYNSVENQLRAINETHQLLAGNGIKHWLHGGWAVDFLIGKVTRDHSDVEMVIWEKDKNIVRNLLEQSDFTEVETEFPMEGFVVEDKNRKTKVHFVYIKKVDSGSVVSLGRWSDWPWPTGSFGNQVGNIDNVSVPVVSAEGQLDSKLNFSKHKHGSPPRDKDNADIIKLQSYLAAKS